MERIESERTSRHDVLRVSVGELEELEREVGPDAFGHLSEGFKEIVIELENGRELSFTGYGSGSVSLAVDGDGLNGKSCLECGKEKSDWNLNKIRGGPEKRAIYLCDCCKRENPISKLL